MLIRDLLEIINQGIESTESINLDSPVAFTFGDAAQERNLHLSEGGVAVATNMETGEREDILYLSFIPNNPDMEEVKDKLAELLGKESLKHMKTEGNA